jgi:hypothetical protein
MSRDPLASTWCAGALVALTIATASNAIAEPEPPVDVVIPETPPPRRIVVLGWNPLSLVLGKASFDVVVVPRDHHGLILSPFYASTSTEPIFVFDDMGNPRQLAKQTFSGFGGELGYRYYFDELGPRGFFMGPSLIVGWFTAQAGDGSQTAFLQYGAAVDVGYQTLIADRLSLTLGGGLEVVATNKSIPQQQFPARFYANFGVLPRLLLSVGWAF